MSQKAICLTLLTSTGTQLFAGFVPVGACTPTAYTVTIGTTAVNVGDTTATVAALPIAIPKGNRLGFAQLVTIATSAAATTGATSLTVAALGAAVPAGTSLIFGTTTVITTSDAAASATTLLINPAPAAIALGAIASFRPNPVVLILAADAPAAATAIAIEPAIGAVATGLTASTYALVEILGGENSPFQGQMQTNSVTLLNTGGWVSKAQAQGDYNIQWTGYVPLSSSGAAGYRLIKNAWYNKRYLYIERYLSNGDKTAGTVVVTNFSEQVQQAQYVQYQCTFDGHESPAYALTSDSSSSTSSNSTSSSPSPSPAPAPSPTPTPTPAPTPAPTPSPTPSPAPTPTPTPAGVTARSSITNWGINASFIGDSYADKIFADAMRTMRYTTVTDAFDTTGGQSLSMDAFGYPQQDFGIFLWDAATGVDFSGTYGLSFTGQADILPDGFTMSNYTYDSINNKTTADLHMVVGGSGVMRFQNTKRTPTSSTNTGVSNLKIMRPVSNGASTYYPTTTTFTDPIKTEFSLFTRIRFLDLMFINGNPSSSWAARVLPSQRDQQGDNGISWEYVIQLCNETNSDAYICIPVKADDDYITQLATLFKNGSTINGVTYAGLNSGLKVYIEYGNELWNDSPGFGQGEMVRLMAIAEMQSTSGTSALNYDNSWDGSANGNWYLKYRWAGRRVTQIAQIWKSVFGVTAYNAQVYPVYMWQQYNGNVTGDIGLAMIERIADGLGVATNTLAKAGGGSHYYSPDNGSDSLTIDNIWSSGTFNAAEFAKILEADLSRALGHGLQFLCYEGGPGLDNTGHSESVKSAAWADPRMRTLVVNQHKLIEQYAGVTTYYYAGGTGTGYYQWGFTQDPAVLTTQKLLAIQDLNARTAREAVTAGTLLPATVLAASYALNGDGDAHSKTAASVPFIRNGWDNVWLFRSATTRSYNFAITYDGPNPPQVKIRVNGAVQYTGTFTATSDYGTPVSSPTISLLLIAGINAVRISVFGGDTNFYNLSLT